MSQRASSGLSTDSTKNGKRTVKTLLTLIIAAIIFPIPMISNSRLSKKMKVETELTVLAHQEAFAVSRTKFTGIVGGFGSGKSQAIVYRAMELLKRRKWAVIPVYAPTYRDLADINIPDFHNLFDMYGIRYSWSASHRKMIIRQGVFTGEIWFRSMSNPEGIVGYDATDSLSDEVDLLKPKKQKIFFTKMIARMRGCKDSTAGLATTPEGFRMMYEWFEKNPIGPLIRAKTTDNHFLPADYVQTMFDQYDDLLRKQYLDAEFVNINGMQAYYGFKRGVNHLSNSDFNDKFGNIEKNHPVYCIGMDFNVHKMCAEVFIHIPSERRIHFFDEIALKHPGYSDKPQTQVMCDIIKRQYPDKEIHVYPDPSAKHRETSATNSDIAILEKNGFRVYAHAGNPPVRDRLNSANTMFGQGRATMDTEKCPELTEDLEKCERDKFGEIDKKDEARTHASDAGTYPIEFLYPIRNAGKVRIVGMG